MARAKKETVTAEVNVGVSTPEVATVEKKEVVETKTPKSSSYDVIRGSIYVRTYSEEVHGENYLELANQFAGKTSKQGVSKVVPSDSILSVDVRYREKEDAELPLDQQDPNKPFVDKERRFTKKEEAISFSIAKKGTVVVAQVAK